MHQDVLELIRARCVKDMRDIKLPEEGLCALPCEEADRQVQAKRSVEEGRALLLHKQERRGDSLPSINCIQDYYLSSVQNCCELKMEPLGSSWPIQLAASSILHTRLGPAYKTCKFVLFILSANFMISLAYL